VTPLVFVVAAAATYSLTLLVVCDKITDRPRQWLLTKISGHGYAGTRVGIDPATDRPGAVVGHSCACGLMWHYDVGEVLDHVHDAREEIVQEIPMSKRAALLYLLRCPWCTSMWVSVPVLWSAWCFGIRAWWFVPAAALAARGITGTWAQFANPRS
jgi:hypothetical protein